MTTIYELFTSDGEYEDYREYILYRNTDRKIVESVKSDVEKELQRLYSKKIRGVTEKDIEKYNICELTDDEKWQKIYDQKQIEYKIEGLSALEIKEKEFNGEPDIANIIATLGL